MNEQKNAKTNEAESAQPDMRVGAYGLAMVMSFAWLLMSFGDYPLLVFIAILSAAMTFFFRTWFVGLIYFLALGFLFMTEPRLYRTVGGLFFSEWVYAFCVITFLISANRYLVLTSPVLAYGSLSLKEACLEAFEFVRSSLHSSPTGQLTRKATKNSRLEPRDTSTIRSEEFISAGARVLISIFIASMLLSAVSLNTTSRVRFGLTMIGFRAASMVWLLIGVVLLLGLLFTPISWLRHSPLQAGVYLRTQLTRWCFGDLRRMARNLIKHRHQSTVHRLGRGKAKRVPVLDNDGSVVRASDSRKQIKERK